MVPDAPSCLASQPVGQPLHKVPPGSWDCHAHVIGPFADYPLQAERGYTPEETQLPVYRRMLAQLGIGQGVVVQPSIYGTDNRVTVDATRSDEGALRGVVVLGADATREMVAGFHHAGIRGFRVNVLFPGGPGLALLEQHARLVADFGWHAQLLIDIRNLTGLAPVLDRLPVPFVFDHMGHFPAEMGTDWTGFQRMLDYLVKGRAYAKLSGSYRMAAGPGHLEAAAPIAQSLIAAAPGRLVWGSDWPHVGLSADMPRTEALLDGLVQWCPDKATRHRILVDTPLSLYG